VKPAKDRPKTWKHPLREGEGGRTDQSHRKEKKCDKSKLNFPPKRREEKAKKSKTVAGEVKVWFVRR